MNERDKELAKQAWTENDWEGHVKWKKFSDLIRADEREACALICEELELPEWPDKIRQPLAQAIRARGNA
jgi:hypothetical protein